MLGTLASALHNPVIAGAGVGGLGGATTGLLTGEEPNRFRNALVGGATGAGIGALAGGLAASGGLPDEAINRLIVRGYEGAISDAITSPKLMGDILEHMNPDARKLVLKKFDKSWLTRLFGG